MTSAPRYFPFAVVFATFAFLITAANLSAELSPNLTFGRVIGSILVSAFLAMPALVLFFSQDLADSTPLYFRYWQLTWAFAFLAYALHFYFSAGEWFHWDFSQMRRRQSLLVLGANITLLVVWGADVCLGLRGQGAGGRAGLTLRWIAHLLFVIAFTTASLWFRSDSRTTLSLIFGILIIVLLAGSLVFRRWK